MAQEFVERVNSKIQEANKLFRSKQYFASLEAYNNGIRMLQGSNYQASLENLRLNLYSLRGMNYTALRDFEKAESDFNLVLASREYDSTALTRRAVLLMKTKEYERALKDICKLSQLEPESLRVAALLLEVKDKIAQSNDPKLQGQLKAFEEGKTVPKSPTVSDSEEDSADEEELLNFSGLRNIERASTMVKKPIQNNRCSIVSFKEDTVCDYEAQDSHPPKKPMRFSIELAKQVMDTQEKDLLELQKAEEEIRKENNIKVICRQSVLKMPKKSILKQSVMLKLAPVQTPTTEQTHNLDIMKIKDPEGKVIHNRSSRVTFRQSRIEPALAAILKQQQTQPQAKPTRKSCLKKCSFAGPILIPIAEAQATNGNGVPARRRSSRGSFVGLKIDKAEGKVVAHDPNAAKADIIQEEQASSKSFDSSDEHNIFGQTPVELSVQVKNALGILDDSIKQPKQPRSSQAARAPKKSILKKISIAVPSVAPKAMFEKSRTSVLDQLKLEPKFEEPAIPAKKPKKSVLFKS